MKQHDDSANKGHFDQPHFTSIIDTSKRVLKERNPFPIESSEEGIASNRNDICLDQQQMAQKSQCFN